MPRSLPIAIVLAFGSVGCSEFDALQAELLVPDDIALHWDRSFNGQGDDRVALVPVDLMVYGPESGEPVGGMELLVEPGHLAVEVLGVDEILPVDAEDCELTPCVWDAWRDRYVELLQPESLADGLTTDDNGLVRAYLLVDGFPESEGLNADFEAVTVLVSMGMTDATFQLVPQ